MNEYDKKWIITIEAHSVKGAMKAVFEIWQAWSDHKEPVCGSTPKDYANGMIYKVRKYNIETKEK
jgi:hypothetical protein